MIRSLLCLLLILIGLPCAARADVEQGVDWLLDRETPAGVHRDSDMVNALDGNAEAWLTAFSLGQTARLVHLAQAAGTAADGGVLDGARRALILLQQGRSADADLNTLLPAQQRDGGYPTHAGGSSDALATAYMLRALDRAGRGGQTPAQRALGFLIASQRGDGGWPGVPGADSSIWVSAQVSLALQAFATRFDLRLVLDRARNYLLAGPDPDGGFAEQFDAALSIEALVALGVERSRFASSVAWLQARQQGNGSFSDDAYLTALALRALYAYEQPFVDPDLAGLRGIVLSADTEQPITGATLSLSGAASATITSNNRGELNANNLVGGSYQAQLSFPGMRTVSFEFSVAGGRIVDLGTLRMSQGGGPGNLFGVVRGRVVDAGTGLPIAGARLRLESPANEVLSDADGRFQFLQLAPGPIRINASATDYCDASMVTTAEARVVVEATFRLNPRGVSGTTAEVRGTIVDGSSGAPLAGVQVGASVGGPTPSATTAADGSYALSLDADGVVSLTASLAGYDSVSLSTLLVPNQVFDFSPRLYPEGETPPGANRASVRGVVLNQANRQPIANALVVVSDPGGQQTVRTSNDGSFEVINLTGPEVSLAVSADAFDPARFIVPITPLERRDVGVIGLKPTAIDFYFPDLVIVNSTLAETDPDLFALSQGFEVEIANRGTSAVAQDFDLIAFVDADGNGLFDPATESEAGRVRIDRNLPIGGAVDAQIAVSAQLTFRDAPIGFLVDIDNEVPEQDEQNNQGSSLLGCRVTPAFIGNDSIEEAWRWRGLSSNPMINSLNQVPVVGQLTDDNGDGAINEYDIPDLVFVAAGRAQFGPASTALVAISGADGSEHWARTDVNLSHFSSLALGDIDNDGIAEIVGVRGYREELIAFEHTGQLKWRVPLSGPSVPEVLLPPPPYVYDQITIVNLEGDNEAEIIHGRQAFRGISGEKLWEGAHDAGGDGGLPIGEEVREAFGVGAIAADINLDGVMEVVAGRSAYDADGRTLWHRADIKPIPYTDADRTPMNLSGLNAIGNFDLDDFPEIVLSIGDELYLLEHSGETIWGPKFAPDFGQLGAPSIADIDGDGLPEIMISSNRRLTMFESDGTVKWTANINDDSGVTSATVFDFENDGLFEVIHMDEEDFRIFDALTGALLFETRNTSVTVYEYPVVADIDGDKQAEVILTGFEANLVAGSTPGIRVFKARNGAWADAGGVWGSQSFHINEINEDSTVPLLETPSWLTHNTYRVQRSPFPDPLGMPDFSVGDLRLIDQGPGRLPSVEVRVGNAGPVDAHEPPWIGVYRGDPANGGVLLAETRLDTLRPARFQVVNLGEVALGGSGDLYAVADARGRARECREGNNQRSVPFSASNGRGVLQLGVDRASYAPGAQVAVSAQVENRGGVPADYRVEMEIRSATDRTVHRFEAISVSALAPLLPRVIESLWDSGDALAGSFRIEGMLLDAEGQLVDTASVPFVIEGTGTGAALRLLTDKASYRAGETVYLSVEATNLSASEVLRSPQILIEAEGPGGERLQRTLSLDDLFAGAGFRTELSLDEALTAGSWQVNGSLRSLLGGGDLANASAAFVRAEDLAAQLSGSVDAQLPSVLAGQAQNCLVTVRNTGNGAIQSMPMRRQVVAETGGEVKLQVEEMLSLGASASQAANQVVSTSGFADGLYACTLEVRQGSEWRVLDADGFLVTGGAPAGIIAEPLRGLSTSEAGASARFTVVLTSAPSGNVRVPLQVSDPAEWQLAVSELNFSPATWNIPRQVDVLGLDDAVADGDQLGLVRLLPAESSDPAYNGLDGDDVEITNLDDDGAQVLVSPTVLQTSEAGQNAFFSVRLSSQPSGPVQIAVESSDSSEWAVSVDVLDFDSGNWNQPFDVEVRGLDDSLFDGTQNGTIRLLPAISSDPGFNGRDPIDVQVSNLDDERPEVLVAPAIVQTSESGSAGSFVVRLSAAPGASVRVPIGAIDASEWRVDMLEVRLDAGNWRDGVVVPVQPVDDLDIDGEQRATLLLGPARSSDSSFDQLVVPSIELVNADDDGARLIVEPLSVVVSEQGGSATFSVRPSEAPTADIEIALSNQGSPRFLLSPAVLRLPAGSLAPQTVTVTGVDDGLANGNQALPARLGSVQSADGRFAGQDPQDVIVTVIDDEEIAVIIEPDGALVTSEAGDSASFEVRLSAPPNADVRLVLSSPDAGEWLLDQAELLFTAVDWQQPRRVLVSGVDDTLIDGDIQALLILPPVQSSDSRYAGLDPRDLLLVNRDDDVLTEPPGIQLALVGPPRITEGQSTVLELWLLTRPQAAVEIDLQALLWTGNAAQGAFRIEPAQLRIEPADWARRWSLRLITVDDSLATGDYQIQTRGDPARSDDAGYAGLSPLPVLVGVIDNDGGRLVQIPVGQPWAFALLALLLGGLGAARMPSAARRH